MDTLNSVKWKNLSSSIFCPHVEADPSSNQEMMEFEFDFLKFFATNIRKKFAKTIVFQIKDSYTSGHFSHSLVNFCLGTRYLSEDRYQVKHPQIVLELDILKQIDQLCEHSTLFGSKALLRGALVANQLYQKRKYAPNLIDSYTAPILCTARRAFNEWKNWRATQRASAVLYGIFAPLIILLLQFIRILIVCSRKTFTEVSTFSSVLSPRRRDEVYRKKRLTPSVLDLSDDFVLIFQTRGQVQRLQHSTI